MQKTSVLNFCFAHISASIHQNFRILVPTPHNLKSKKAEVPTIEIKKTSSVLNIFREFLTSHHQQLVKFDTLQETKLGFTY